MSNLLPDYLNPSPSQTVGDGTLPTVDEVLHLLGYQEHQITTSLIGLVRTNLKPFEQLRVIELLSELKAVDAAIKEAIADSGITKTCDSEIDWRVQVGMLRQQGHEALAELSRIYDVKVEYSRFVRTKKQYSIQYQ